MSWSNRVVWGEGLFLRAQHFQQQDRWADASLRARTAAMAPHPWGFTEVEVDRDLLATGRFALSRAAGVLEDGTPFSIPDDADHPPPLEVPENARNAVVYLAVPIRQPGGMEVVPEGGDGAVNARHAGRPFEAFDTHSASPVPAEVQVGRLRARYMLETEERAGWLCLGLARIVEVASDRRVTLQAAMDGGGLPYIPSVMKVSASAVLRGLVAELAGMLNQRGEAFAARLGGSGAKGVPEVTDFLLLQTVNRWQPLLAHWADAGNVHPETLYRCLLQMTGEFCTFTEATKRPNAYPAYRHEDLQRSFSPVVADLRRSLSAVIETSAVRIDLQERRHGVRVGPIVDRALLRGSQFVLTVQSDMPAEALRRTFPAQAKIGAVEHIRELVNVQLPGITARPLPVAPRQIPFYAGAVYFELDRGSPHWAQMQNSGGFAIYVSGEFPNLRMDLWAIRG
jgi:type VI secretion system protein ImpJ